MITSFFVAMACVPADAASRKSKTSAKPLLTAKSYAVVDADDGRILYGKNPRLKLPPASTTKLMTVLLAKERLSMNDRITIGHNAANVQPSKAGLTPGAEYRVGDLIRAALVSSSNDAAIALAEAVAGSEKEFVKLMNLRARELGMNDTFFANSTGLTDKRRGQYTTAYDLTRLMREAVKDKRIDDMMGITQSSLTGSDGKVIPLRTHNKMLWRIPKFVKGKTGWTSAAKHTFVGTDYAASKSITFAMLSSQKPWTDIERLATFGLALART